MQNITSPPQVNAEVAINENFQTVLPAELYGLRQPATTGLTWGYYGGRFNGNTINNGTVALTASNTNYIVAARSNGAVSVSTATTNWNNQTDYLRLYTVVAGAATITSAVDERQAFGVVGLSNPMTTSGDIIIGGTAGAPTRLGVGTNGFILTLAAGVPTWAASPGSPVQCIPIAISDETTALTAGNGKVTFRMPFAFTLSAVRSSVTTAPTGANLVVDINEGGASILSTKLSIDATEKTSTTAATPAVISDASLADDAEITIDVDQIGSTIAGAGLKVYLIGTKT